MKKFPRVLLVLCVLIVASLTALIILLRDDQKAEKPSQPSSPPNLVSTPAPPGTQPKSNAQSNNPPSAPQLPSSPPVQQPHHVFQSPLQTPSHSLPQKSSPTTTASTRYPVNLPPVVPVPQGELSTIRFPERWQGGRILAAGRENGTGRRILIIQPDSLPYPVRIVEKDPNVNKTSDPRRSDLAALDHELVADRLIVNLGPNATDADAE
ncbi:MAG: hypothetical protein NZL93_03470, partial [Chthoniobacterales bacterium]|nr:hypothetical protein [Chthoniobacterales bacterium]